MKDYIIDVTPKPLSAADYFFVPAVLFAGLQYWRLPQENHWIALSFAGFFGLVTLIFLTDFLRKRNT